MTRCSRISAETTTASCTSAWMTTRWRSREWRTRPTPSTAGRAARFTLETPAGQAEVSLVLPGLYNVYNALAAAALATALEVPLETIAAGLSATKAAFGRAETVTLSVPAGATAREVPAVARPATRELRILLVKNPAGANEVL